MENKETTIYLLKFALEVLTDNDLENEIDKNNWVIGRDIETHLEELKNIDEAVRQIEQLKGKIIQTLEEWIKENCTKPSFGTYVYKGENYSTWLELHPFYVKEIVKNL